MSSYTRERIYKADVEVGTIDIMTAEQGGTPLVALHAGGECKLLDTTSCNMYVDELWLEFIEAIEEIICLARVQGRQVP